MDDSLQVRFDEHGAGSCPSPFHFPAKNRIGAIFTNDGRHILSLARHGPQRLDGVERRPVTFETDNPFVRFGGGGTDSARESLTDRTTSECHVGKRWCAGRKPVVSEPSRCPFVHDNEIVRLGGSNCLTHGEWRKYT